MTNRTPIGAAPITPSFASSRVEWSASWLKDPIFDGLDYRELIHPNRKPENNGEIQNVHTLFRRELMLPSRRIRQARLYVTADDCYKLYVNGDFVGTGPAASYPFDYHYNAWDVSSLLRTGEANCIGMHVFYQGMHSLTFTSADNLQGLLLQLEVEFEDGSALTLLSDRSWRCFQTHAYRAQQIYGYQTAFSEHIDLRKIPHGWMLPDFDDSQWKAPYAGPVPDIYSLSPQATPPVATFRTEPARLVRLGEGHYFIDFGTELSGESVFVVTGDTGHQVEVRHGEELDDHGHVRYEMRCNCTYQEFCILSGRKDEALEFFDYKGFRYVEVLNWPEELTADRVWAHERHYPFPADASAFRSSDPLLNDVWELCSNGVRVGTLDTYLDCPTREKGGFLGDGYVTGISHLILTGDARILRKFISDVANTRRFCNGLLSTAPNYVNGELAEYSLLWPLLLEYYYLWTADVEFVREMAPVLQGLLDYYAGYENTDGLLQDVFSHTTGRYSILVDWPQNLRDDYDDPYLMGSRTVTEDPSGVVNTMVQGFYHNALQAAGRLGEVVGSGSIKRGLEGKADRLRKSVLGLLRDPETGLFVDRNASTHSAFHANVSPFMAGMLPEDELAPILAFLRQKRISCGVYFSCFLLKGLYEHGEADFAYDLMTSHDLHSWYSMLEAGATTCMEAWAPELKWNTSWCHPWSSAPIHMVAHEMMGLTPGSPGWEHVSFSPQPPSALASASLSITTPRGMLSASFERRSHAVTYQLVLPVGCTASCAFPGEQGAILLDGSEAPGVARCDKYGIKKLALQEPLEAGEHEMSVSVTGAT